MKENPSERYGIRIFMDFSFLIVVGDELFDTKQHIIFFSLSGQIYCGKMKDANCSLTFLQHYFIYLFVCLSLSICHRPY